MWRTRDLIIVLIVSITLLASLEWLARQILLESLATTQAPRALALLNKESIKKKLVYPKIDPLLGWAGSEGPVFNESVVILESKFSQPKKMLVLGGSTSDLHFQDKSWPYYLARLFEQKGLAVDIHVGAIGGYNSHQELLKIVRDARLVTYDLILSYTGANEAVDRYNQHPFTTLHTQYFLHRALPPSKTFIGISSLLQEWTSPIQLSFGPKDTLSITKRFLTNIQSAHALSKVYGARYVAILQPYLTSGHRSLSENEKKLLDNHITKDLVKTNKKLYNEVKKAVRNLNFFYDGSRFLDPLQEVYYDDCHINDEGNEHLATKIAQLIHENNLLK